MVDSAVSWRLSPTTSRPEPEHLVGPRRIITLSAQGAQALDRLLSGESVPDIRNLLLDAGFLEVSAKPTAEITDVTVVIPTNRNVSRVTRCLASIPPECSVIVVNDGDNEFLAPDSRTTVVRSGGLGPAAARNAGLLKAQTEFVAFVDDDVTLSVDWIYRLRALLNEDCFDLVAGRIMSGDGTGIAGYIESASCPLDMGDESGVVGKGRQVTYLPSAAFLARRSALGGGFDESLHVGEDVDVIWRLKGRAYYDASVIAFHEPRTNIADVVARRYIYGTSAAALDRRHPGELAHLHLSPWTAAPWLALWFGGPLAAGVALAAGIAVSRRELSSVPDGIAYRVVAAAHSRSGLAVGRATVRPYLPISVALSVVSKKFRRRVLPVLVVAYLADRPTVAAIVDDIAYSAGVWAGCVKYRNVRPLIPRFTWRSTSRRKSR